MLERTLVFVDTSYLLASFYNSWETGARAQLEIDLPEVVTVLGKMITSQLNQPIHRQLWYDGIPDSGPHRYQRALRTCDGVQLRAGQLIEWGDRRTQKGVDTRLVADMVISAMRHDVTDIVLVSGDADMIPGVQEATRNGMRVHLYGFGWDSMSSALRHNCDTTTILDPREDFCDAMQLQVLEGPLPPVVHAKPLGDAEPLDGDEGMAPVPDSSMPPAMPVPNASGEGAGAEGAGAEGADEAANGTSPSPASTGDDAAGDLQKQAGQHPQPTPWMEKDSGEFPRSSMAASPTAAADCSGPESATKEVSPDELAEELRDVGEADLASDEVATAGASGAGASGAGASGAGAGASSASASAPKPGPPKPSAIKPSASRTGDDRGESRRGATPADAAAAGGAAGSSTNAASGSASSAPKPSMMAPRRKLRSRYVPLPEEIWESAGYQTPFDVGQQYASWWYDNAATSEQRDHAHMLSGGGLPPEIDRPLLQFACETLHEYTLSETQRVNLRDGFHSGIRGVLMNLRRQE